MNINFAICDDEHVETDYLAAAVKKWSGLRLHSVAVSVFDSAESLLFNYSDNKNIDILLLDIQMKGINGVELARQIREDNAGIQIIFITGVPDFIAEGYEVSALHYLMKPVSEEKLFEVFDKALRRLSKEGRIIFLPVDGESVRISVGDIMYVESFSHYLEIVTIDGRLTVKMPVYALERQLGGDFVRCHRSYLCGLKHVKKITKTDVILDNDKAVPLSRRLYNEVNKQLIKHFTGDE